MYSHVLPSMQQDAISRLNDTLGKHRGDEEWRDADIRWNFTSPLLNFASDVKQEVAISDFIQLTPFSTREKTERWNYHSYAMLEIAVESIPLSRPLRL